MKRILFCHPGTELYGSDRMAVQTVKGLLASGFDVKVVIPGEGVLKGFFEGVGASTIVCPVPVLRKNLMNPRGLFKLMIESAGSFLSALGTIRSFKPDIVYVNTIIQPMWIYLAFALGKKTVAHVREAENSSSKFLKFILVFPLALSSKVICNSKSTKAFVDGAYSRLAGKSHVVYNGKNWRGYFRSQPAAKIISLELLLVGRISQRKGQDVAITALSIIRGQGIDARLTFVGDVFPGYEWYLEELRISIDYLALGDYIDFLGFVDDVSPHLERSSIVLVPSRIEPFGTVALEGMAAMRPVIASRTEGLAEIVTDCETGLLVEPGDADALANAIVRLSDDSELYREIAATGFDYVNRAFSSKNYDSEITEICNAVLAPVRGGR